jgi:hypothetical protein
MGSVKPFKVRSKGTKLDFTATALSVVEQAIGEHMDGSPLETRIPLEETMATKRGRLGGLKGGEARASKLTAKRRKEIAKKAAKSRWNK